MEAQARPTAFITGGASGLGLGMAKAFLEQGMSVAIADIMPDHLDVARRVLDQPRRTHFVRLDVTDRQAFALAAEEAEAELGPVSILCNNAGVGLLEANQDATSQNWDWVMSVNLGGAINGVLTFLPKMLDREKGYIVNTASIGAVLPGPGGAAYLTSKAAILGLSETLLCDLRGTGIGVTAILLGPTATNITDVSKQRAMAFPDAATSSEAAAKMDKPIIAGGKDPLEVGRMVIAAMARNQPYLFTHPEFRHAVRQRFDAIMSCFGGDPDGPIETVSYGFPTFNPVFAEIIKANEEESMKGVQDA